MQINILSFGQDVAHIKELCAYYIKITNWKINDLILKSKNTNALIAKDLQVAIDNDTNIIVDRLIKINKNGINKNILLDVEGQNINTNQFKDIINNSMINACNINFIIGNAFGINKQILSQNIKYNSISLSNLTFPHKVAKFILLEQIYRSYTIISGKNYHK